MTHHLKQRTLARPASCTGVGVHSGREVTLTIRPAPVNHGIRFIRTDLLNSPSISALFNMVVDTSLATVIGYDGFIVSTIEHLMASFYGLSIDNALVEINDYEVPIMDGSAAPFAAMIREAGIVKQEAPRFFFVIKEPIELNENGKSVGLYPDETTRISYQIEFDHPLIQTQSLSFPMTDEHFEAQISKARTFGFIKEYQLLKQYGLGRGASLDNTVVMNETGILNRTGLRFDDEFVRHKILDCIGDFSLLGMPILGHLKIKKSGHQFNHLFLERFFLSKSSWEARPLPS